VASFSYLTEEEMQQLAEIHFSALPLKKGISDYDVKLVQRLFVLHTTRSLVV
jgi:hypothetical protein